MKRLSRRLILRDMSRRNNRSVFDFLFEAEEDKKDEKDTVAMGDSAEEGNDASLDMSDMDMKEPESDETEEGEGDDFEEKVLDMLGDIKSALESDEESPKTEGEQHEGGLYEE